MWQRVWWYIEHVNTSPCVVGGAICGVAARGDVEESSTVCATLNNTHDTLNNTHTHTTHNHPRLFPCSIVHLHTVQPDTPLGSICRLLVPCIPRIHASLGRAHSRVRRTCRSSRPASCSSWAALLACSRRVAALTFCCRSRRASRSGARAAGSPESKGERARRSSCSLTTSFAYSDA